MITVFRMIRLWQLRIKWKLAFYQLLEQQIKNTAELEQKLLHEIAEVIHNANTLK